MIELLPYFAGLITLLFSIGFYFAIRTNKNNDL